jgi:hypothetical protein
MSLFPDGIAPGQALRLLPQTLRFLLSPNVLARHPFSKFIADFRFPRAENPNDSVALPGLIGDLLGAFTPGGLTSAVFASLRLARASLHRPATIRLGLRPAF